MKREDVVAILKKRQGSLTLRKYAESLGVSAAYLSDVYLGRREVGPKLLKPMGIRKVKTYKIAYERER